MNEFNFKELSINEVDKVLNVLPICIQNTMKTVGGYLAGGFLLNFYDGTFDEINKNKDIPHNESCVEHIAKNGQDIDIFVKDILCADKFIDKIKSDLKMGNITETPNSVNITLPNNLFIQAIHAWSGDTAINTIKNFDFTISQIVLWFDKDTETFKMGCNEAFLLDSKFKKLNYTNPNRLELSAGSFQRMLKYVSRGYKVNSETLTKLIMRIISNLPITNMENKIKLELDLAKNNQY